MCAFERSRSAPAMGSRVDLENAQNVLTSAPKMDWTAIDPLNEG
jgi:hypothetical protein